MSLSRMNQLIVDAGQSNIPLEVSIELTHHCNFRCEHCYIPDFHAPDRMDTRRILALLDELTELGTLYVTFTGGEIFLRRDWYEIAQYARQLGFSIRLFSNAALVSDEIADRIKTLYCAVEVSLYSMEESKFEAVTNRKGSFARTLDGIERLRSRDIEVLLKTPVMQRNLEDLPGISAYAQRIGAVARIDNKVVSRKDGDPSPLGLRVEPEDLIPFYQGPLSGCEMPGRRDSKSKNDGPMCAAANRYANVTSSGDVLACNILPGSGGNLLEKSFREIWQNSPWFKKVRSIRREDLKECSTCDRLDYCGRCHAQALVEDGDILGPSSWARRNAEAMENAFGFPVPVSLGSTSAGEG